MEILVAPVHNITLELEQYLAAQVGAMPLPFPGMDKSGAAVCDFYSRGSCAKAASCPLRHLRGDKTVVCKHWLRGLCKKGDGCEFLHEYDMTKMPECYFYSRFNACHNKECPFLHIDPESKIRDCPWYDRGFCRHGPSCRHRHVRRELCMNYLTGCCPTGPECPDGHPRFEIPVPPDTDSRGGKKVVITCHYCGDVGHKVSTCPKMPADLKEQHMANSPYWNNPGRYQGYNQGSNPEGGGGPSFRGGYHDRGGYYGHRPYGRPYQPRPSNRGSQGDGDEKGSFKNIEDIVCYKCGEKGHFANRCTKGLLAFISLQQNQKQAGENQQNKS